MGEKFIQSEAKRAQVGAKSSFMITWRAIGMEIKVFQPMVGVITNHSNENSKFLNKKLLYIHQNPVCTGRCNLAEDYSPSSAKYYLDAKTSTLITQYMGYIQPVVGVITNHSNENSKFLNKKLLYIHQNPVRKGLCNLPEDYIYSSAKYYLDTKESTLITHYMEHI